MADCTNALIDGADCLMLSGESANGQYPVEAVDFMRSICDETERFVAEEGMGAEAAAALSLEPDDRLDATARGAVLASRAASAAAILCASPDGELARALSRFRPDVPVVVACADAKTARQLQIYRALHPVVLDAAAADPLALLLAACAEAGVTLPGDDVVLVSEEAWSGHSAALTTRIVEVA